VNLFSLWGVVADDAGALLWPIFLVAIISWPRSTPVTHFPHTDLGDSDFNFFKNVVSARGFKLLGPHNVDFSAYGNGRVWIALISFLYVDLLDTTGTLVAMSKQAGLFDMRDGDFEGSSVAFVVDSLCIAMSGLLFGTSPATPFVESASGISEGGRTGLTAIATSFWFFVSIFFAPILSNIPSFATGSVLIVVGALMMGNVTKINFDYAGDAIPAFVALALIPLTCESIPNGTVHILTLQITSPMVSLRVSSSSSLSTMFPCFSARSLLDCFPQDGTISRSHTTSPLWFVNKTHMADLVRSPSSHHGSGS
jgi:xanthine/uracil/vitamin C permease (AzgA family)